MRFFIVLKFFFNLWCIIGLILQSFCRKGIGYALLTQKRGKHLMTKFLFKGDGLSRTNGRLREEDDVDDEDDGDEDGDLEEELEADFLSGPGSGARLSSTSLASSSSSSGGGVEASRRRIIAAVPPPPCNQTPQPPSGDLPNNTQEDSAISRESVNVTSTSFQQPSSQGRNPSMGAIPKSISFDKTAERGDKVSILLKRAMVRSLCKILLYVLFHLYPESVEVQSFSVDYFIIFHPVIHSRICSQTELCFMVCGFIKKFEESNAFMRCFLVFSHIKIA